MIIRFEFNMIDGLVDLSEYKIIENSFYKNSDSILNNGYVLVIGDIHYILINTDLFTGMGKIQHISHLDNKEDLINYILMIKREMIIDKII